MVWGGISLTARTDLVVDNGAMNADRYIRNILEEHVVPFVPYIGEKFIFMDDNTIVRASFRSTLKRLKSLEWNG